MEKNHKTEEKNLDQNQVLPLHPKEVDLILAMRNRFRFGEITIKIRDGRPYSVEKTTITEILGL